MSRTYTAPSSKGFYVYEWNTDCDEPIVCHLNYTKACRGSFERGGLQIEPDEPENMELAAAYLLDVDIFYLLDEKQIAFIEERALVQMSEEAQEYCE